MGSGLAPWPADVLDVDESDRDSPQAAQLPSIILSGVSSSLECRRSATFVHRVGGRIQFRREGQNESRTRTFDGYLVATAVMPISTPAK
jgi:hypothetical protein